MNGYEQVEYLLCKIQMLEKRNQELYTELKRLLGPHIAMLTELDSKSVYVALRCPKCGLETIQRKLP